MADSRKSSKSKSHRSDLAVHLLARLVPVVSAGDHLMVGLSGGVDSMVLLDCLRRVAGRLRIRLSALHINHQLHADAARWAGFCRRQCRARNIPYAGAKVEIAPGDSVEAAARAARYAVFARQRADYIVLAQHQDDQVETLLLQLLRGAGVKGLAAMPLLRRAEGGTQMADGGRRMAKGKGEKTGHPSSFIPQPSILRPFLDVTRAEILDYAHARGLQWIDDDSNANLDFRRNFLRHEVLPRIARRFPSYRATVARSARHLAEASVLLDELAAQDAADGFDGESLAVASLRGLARARARNVLRFFLARKGVTMPNVERLEEALRQALTARQDARVAVELDGGVLRRYAGRLHIVPARHAAPRSFARRWHGQREMALPELGGVLSFRRTREHGISVARLQAEPVTIRLRQGGERLQPDARRPRRSLKNLLQEAQVAPWQRDCLPLIYCGNRVAWAAGVGVDCAFQARRGEAALRPEWKRVPR